MAIFGALKAERAAGQLHFGGGSDQSPLQSGAEGRRRPGAAGQGGARTPFPHQHPDGMRVFPQAEFHVYPLREGRVVLDEGAADLKQPLIGEKIVGDGVGIAGGKGEGLLFAKGKILRKVPQEQLVDALFEEIDKL